MLLVNRFVDEREMYAEHLRAYDLTVLIAPHLDHALRSWPGCVALAWLSAVGSVDASPLVFSHSTTANHR